MVKYRELVFIGLIVVLFCSSSCAQKNKSQIIEEQSGIVIVEAESFVSQQKDDVRQWKLVKDDDKAAKASGKAYLQILPDTRIDHDDKIIDGENYSGIPGEMAILTYEVKFNNPGRYFVWVKTFTEGYEDNSIHVGLNKTWPDSGARLQFDGAQNKWFWDSKQRTEDIHAGVPKQIYLDIKEPGVHQIHFSMREDGFCFDQWAMTKKYEIPSD